MNIKELSEKTIKELDLLMNNRKESFRILKFKVCSANLKNVKEISKSKKDIARILTVLRSK